VFLDIGGGTIDGAIFRLYRHDGKPKVTVLSTSVADLGTEILAERASLVLGDFEHCRELLFGLGPFDPPPWATLRSDVGAFFGKLFVDARRLDSASDWSGDHRSYPYWRVFDDVSVNANALSVFFGGGGIASHLHREAVTRAEKGLRANYGCPPLNLGEVIGPRDFEGTADAPFHRMAVAYGLARSPLAALEWKLPSELDHISARHPARRPTIHDYSESKDRYQ
jgi:hypothetical protein